MDSEYIAFIALLISIISLALSFLSLYRDRHVINARYSIYEMPAAPEKLNLSISVANAGKRPITICFITVRPKSSPGMSIPFSTEGSVQIDVGGVAVANILAGSPAALWQSVSDIKSCQIFIQDALGKNHLVK